MSNMLQWTFKYEPVVLNDMILSDTNKKVLQKVIEESPNIILSGNPGTGKGTFTNIYLKETGYDYIKINASNENNIDTMRNKIYDFATSLAATKYKIVYLNECDYITPNAFGLLRDLIETVHAHTRFVLTCNYINKVPDPILSRCQHIEMDTPPAKSIFAHCMKVMNDENIEIVDKTQFQQSLINLIKTSYPDIRKIINSLEMSVIDGKIEKIETLTTNETFEELFQYMLKGDVENIRKVLRNNVIDYQSMYHYLYDHWTDFSQPGEAIIDISEYLYRDATSSIKEVNFMGMVLKMMKEETL